MTSRIREPGFSSATPPFPTACCRRPFAINCRRRFQVPAAGYFVPPVCYRLLLGYPFVRCCFVTPPLGGSVNEANNAIGMFSPQKQSYKETTISALRLATSGGAFAILASFFLRAAIQWLLGNRMKSCTILGFCSEIGSMGSQLYHRKQRGCFLATKCSVLAPPWYGYALNP